MDKLQAYWIELLFSAMIVISIITNNKTVGISAVIILVLRLLRVNPVLEVLDKNGISWGIILLTVGFLAPLALDKYQPSDLISVFQSPAGWIAIASGILMTIFGAKGIEIGNTDVMVSLGVVVGTFIGVGVFKGSPTGPLIGSGMAAFGIMLARLFFKF